MLKFRCRACSGAMGVERSRSGKSVKCPHCGEMNRVPQPKQAVADAERGNAPAVPPRSPEPSVPQIAQPLGSVPAALPIPVASPIPVATPVVAPPAVQIAVDSGSRSRSRRSPRPTRGKRRTSVVLLIVGGSAAVLLTVMIGLFALRNHAASPLTNQHPPAPTAPISPAPAVASGPASAPAPAAASASTPPPSVIDPLPESVAADAGDPLPRTAVAAGVDAPYADVESDVSARLAESPRQPDERVGQPGDPPLGEPAEPPGGISDLPRVEVDELSISPPPVSAESLPQFSANGLTQQDVDRLLELYDSRSLFSAKEYPTLRRLFATRFQRAYAKEIEGAWGEDSSAMAQWLDENPLLKEELFLAIDPQADDVSGALRVFKELKDRFPDQILRYGNLAIALAVTWDQPRAIYDYGSHQRRAKATLPDGLLEAADNFAYFLTTEQVMQGRGQWLPWEFLVHTIDHKTPLAERQWALLNYLPARQMIGKCYSNVPYDHLMLETGSAQARMNERAYTLENLRTYGGVCALQADFAARVGKSLAVPSAYVGGPSAYGDLHAWVMWVELKTVTAKSIVFSLESHGRYRGDKYYVGTLKDPKSGREITDRQLELRLHTVGMDPIAKRHAELVMAAFPALKEARSLAVNERFAYMNRAVELCPGNERAWIELAAMASDPLVRQKHRKQMAAILNQLFLTFANFPDFTWTIFDDLISYEDRLKERIKLYERLALLYQAAQRPDLASQARLRLTDLLEEDGRQLEAVEGLALTVLAFVDEGRYVPALLDRIERICQDFEGSTPHLLRFYHSFLPSIPQMRGDSPSKYCMQMFERGIKLFQEHGEGAAAEAYRAQLAQIQAGRGRRS